MPQDNIKTLLLLVAGLTVTLFISKCDCEPLKGRTHTSHNSHSTHNSHATHNSHPSHNTHISHPAQNKPPTSFDQPSHTGINKPPTSFNIQAPTHFGGSHSPAPSAPHPPPLPPVSTNQRPIGFQPPPSYPSHPTSYDSVPSYHALPAYHSPPAYQPPAYHAPAYHPPAYQPPPYHPPAYHAPMYTPIYGSPYSGGGYGSPYAGTGYGSSMFHGGTSYERPSSDFGGNLIAGIALWELARHRNYYHVHTINPQSDRGVSRVDDNAKIQPGDTYIVTPNNIPCDITETKTENGRTLHVDCKSPDQFNATVILPSNSTTSIPCIPGPGGKGCVGSITVDDQQLKPVNFSVVNATQIMVDFCTNISKNGDKPFVPPECYPLLNPPPEKLTPEYWSGLCENFAKNMKASNNTNFTVPEECNNLWYPPSYWDEYCTTLLVRTNGTITNETVVPTQCYKIWYPTSYWKEFCTNLTASGAKMNQSDIPADCYNLWGWEDYCYNLSKNLNGTANQTAIPQECYDIWYPKKMNTSDVVQDSKAADGPGAPGYHLEQQDIKSSVTTQFFNCLYLALPLFLLIRNLDLSRILV